MDAVGDLFAVLEGGVEAGVVQRGGQVPVQALLQRGRVAGNIQEHRRDQLAGQPVCNDIVYVINTKQPVIADTVICTAAKKDTDYYYGSTVIAVSTSMHTAHRHLLVHTVREGEGALEDEPP